MTFVEWLNQLYAQAPTPRGKAIISLQTDIGFEVMSPPRNLPALKSEMRTLCYEEDMTKEAEKLWLEFCRLHPRPVKVKTTTNSMTGLNGNGPPYTVHDDDAIMDGLWRGLSYTQIGLEIGRTGKSIGNRIAKMRLKARKSELESHNPDKIPSIQNAYGVSIPYVPSLYREMPR